MIAALFVDPKGSYAGIPGVDLWDEKRDARKYPGYFRVVAHPPCQRWGKFWAGQPLYIKRTGIRQIRGDDGGCFESALLSVRRWGGVLEHPAGSHAWAHFGLAKPPKEGGWIAADKYGYTCQVEQGRYGHYARKPTWLYAVACELPELDWGNSPAVFPESAIEKHGLAYCKRAGELAFKGGGRDSAVRIGTPVAFRDVLLGMARGR